MLAEFINLPKEGDKVGPYLIRECLSASILGGFFLALHRSQQEDVLLHIIPEALTRADAKFVGRYREVIERQKRLPEGPILAVKDMNRVSGNLIIQYEGGNYRSLTQAVVERKQPLAEDTVRHHLATLARGLSEAVKIEQGHFFLTPDFIFLDEDNEVHVAGVGLFQSIYYESFERFISGAIVPIAIDQTRTFSAIEILSPEIRNFKKRDPRGDFYCIGMCAYFMLTGSKPERRWTVPSVKRKGIATGWDLLLSHCLEPRPSDRFPHYRAFLRDLEQLDDLSKSPRREHGRILRVLSKIPMPKFFEQKLSLRAQMFLRLTLLGIAGALSIFTASTFFQIIFFEDATSGSSSPIREVQVEERANLIVSVNPPRARVVISGPQSGKFVLVGKPLMVNGRHGRYTINVSSPKFISQTLEVELSKAGPVVEEIELAYAFAGVEVAGVPGTRVYVETQPGFQLFLGTLDASGVLLVENRLLEGAYSFVAKHPLHLVARLESVEVGSGLTPVVFEQAFRPTRLIVRSDPGGARVIIDGQQVGRTPLELDSLDTGTPIEVKVLRDGFRPREDILVFAKGEHISIDADNLIPLQGSALIRLSTAVDELPVPEDVLLIANGRERDFNEGTPFPLLAGTHSFTIRHPLFYELKRDFTIADRETLTLDFVLEPLPARLFPVVEEGQPVRYRINDEWVPLTSEGYLPIPSCEDVVVEAVIQNYHDVLQHFKGDPTEELRWRVPLKPLPGPDPGDDWEPPYFPYPMVWVGPQLFDMGSPIDEYRRLPNEDNLTAVRVTRGYWIGTTEVTQDLYKRIMGENPSRFDGDDHPVDSVSHEDAMRFCERLTEFEEEGERLPEGYVYRLPTEAEWELAARSGTKTPFSFGEVADPDMGNFQGFYRPGESIGKSSEERYGTIPVSSFPPNAWGLFDVHGNVAEWVLDRFWDRHPGGAVSDPLNGERGRGYTVRGGSWRDSADRVRSAARTSAPETSRRNSIGFRVVLAPVADSLGSAP